MRYIIALSIARSRGAVKLPNLRLRVHKKRAILRLAHFIDVLTYLWHCIFRNDVCSKPARETTMGLSDLRFTHSIFDREDACLKIAVALALSKMDMERPPVVNHSVMGAMAQLGLKCPRFGTLQKLELSPAAHKKACARLQRVTMSITADGAAVATTTADGNTRVTGDRVNVNISAKFGRQWSDTRSRGDRASRRERNGK